MNCRCKYIFVLFLPFACRPVPQPEIIGTTSDGLAIYNLVQNGNFEAWDTPFQPSGWKFVNPLATYAFRQSDSSFEGDWALHVRANTQGAYYLHQSIVVEPRTYYLASVMVSGDIHDWHYGGFTIATPSGSRVLAKHKTAMKSFPNYSGELMAKFYSHELDTVQVSLGFDSGINASVRFDHFRIRKVDEVSLERESQDLLDALGLEDFDSVNYHNNVLSVCATVNQQLKMPKAVRIKFGNRIEPLLTDSSWFNRFFSEPSQSAYCQQASLSVSDLLLQFRIPTQHIHFVDDGVGFHQFIEYWNPYMQRWIIVDPYYGIGYHKNHQLIGYEELIEIKKKGVSEAVWSCSISIDGNTT